MSPVSMLSCHNVSRNKVSNSLQRKIPGGYLEMLTQRNNRSAFQIGHLQGLHELVCHQRQRVRRPRLEPVDGAAVDQRRELPQPRSERVADGREGDYDVQVFLASADEVLEHRQRVEVGVFASFLRHRSTYLLLSEDLV